MYNRAADEGRRSLQEPSRHRKYGVSNRTVIVNSPILGRNIRVLRERRGMTQAALSAEIGMDLRDPEVLERGVSNEIEAEELSALSRLFRVDMDDLWKKCL